MTRIKGEPRTRNEQERKLRALVARIPDAKTLNGFLATLPEAERLPTYRMLLTARTQ